MNKGGRKRLGQLAAVLSLAVASPALADNEPKPSEFEQTIAQAKSLMMADSAAALEFARKAGDQVCLLYTSPSPRD